MSWGGILGYEGNLMCNRSFCTMLDDFDVHVCDTVGHTLRCLKLQTLRSIQHVYHVSEHTSGPFVSVAGTMR